MNSMSVRLGHAFGGDHLRARFRWSTAFFYLVLALMAPVAAEASTYRWQADASGDWNVAANWELVEGPAGAGYPNLAGDVALIDVPLSAARTITIPNGVTITLGRLAVVHATAASEVTIARAGSGLLVFDNLGEDAAIQTNGPGQPTALTTPIELASHLTIDGTVELSAIAESAPARNVTITGGEVTLGGTIGYTGTTTLANGVLFARPNGALVNILGPLVVGDGVGAAGSAIFLAAGGSVNPSADVRVNVDGRATFSTGFGSGGALHAIDGLTIAGGAVTIFEIGVSLTVNDLMMEGGGVVASTSGTSLRLAGSLTATSTAAGPSFIGSGGTVLPRSFVLLPGNHDFTVADGPQAVDLSIQITSFFGSDDTSAFTKKGPGVMQITSHGAPDTRVLEGTLQIAPSGFLNTKSLTIGPAGHVPFDILGGTAGSGYDQVKVTGTVTLDSAPLDLTSAFLLPPNMAFVIIDNDGTDAVNGTFAGAPEGSVVTTASGASFVVSYHGGDGNDVTLTNVTPVTYFLSEGATGEFFDEDLLIANPNTVAAPVTLTFFLPGGGTFVQQRTVPAQSRLTIAVDDIPELAATSPAVEVKSDNHLTLAVERTMFWDQARYGGHTANAVPRLEKEWLFAEGAQNDFFQTYLLLVNPNSTATSATVTFLREDEPPVTKLIPVPAFGRETVYAGDFSELVGRSFGMTVDAPLPIAAERTMYFASTPSRLWTGGHGNEGSARPSTSWFHAEGASGTFFSTFILVSNPQTTPAQVTLRFLLPDGQTSETTRTIQPQQRITVNPVDTGDARLANAAFSTVVSADVPVISERAMYWPGGDTAFGEGHASSGQVSTALDWVLAEGRAGGPFAYTTYILLANASNDPADVTVTFLPENGGPIVKTYTVNGNSRFNIDVGGMVPELQNASFGARVEVTNGVPIAVERSMYWNAEGWFWAGGSNALANVIPR